MAEAVFRHPKGKAQRRIASAGVQGFAEHRQDMGADIEDHPIRVTQLPGIQLPVAKLSATGSPALLKPLGSCK